MLRLLPGRAEAPPESGKGLTERELFDLVYRRMRALAGGRAPDLDDLVQRAMEEVFKSLTKFDGRSELSTWVYGVCYRVLLHERRWLRRFRARFIPGWDELVTESSLPSPAAALEEKARAAALVRALARMSEKYRAVVVLHDLEELSIAEVAEVVKAGELTVRSRLRDGRKQLAKILRLEPTHTKVGRRT